ncbi:MAG TPA: hypothetical protein VF230_00975 [Acidimicrobiales bacterium]
MPRRTTDRQKALYLLRTALAPEGWVVTESEELHDPVVNVLREVDVVARSRLNEIDIVVSFEVIDRVRKAELPWVEQMITKHEHLETNRLVLVSWSGFTGAARTKAASHASVTLMEPVTRTKGDPRTLALYADRVSMTVQMVKATMRLPDGTTPRHRLFPDNAVYNAEGDEVGTLLDVAVKFLENEAFGRQILTEAHNRDDRQGLRGFEAGFGLGSGQPLYLRDEPTGELHAIEELVVLGPLDWSQTPVKLDVARFSDVMFAYGSFQMNGRKTHLVVQTDDDGNATSNIALELETTPPDVSRQQRRH